jgi:putative ABC transport system permease protein
MAAMRPLQVTLVGEGEPERIDGQYVSASYFRVLGVSPALGRDFAEADDRPRAPFVAIISDALWRRRFGGDPAIVGRQVMIEGTPVTVIGVMPSGFENVIAPSAEVWATLQYDRALPVEGREWGHHLSLLGRLRPGVSPAQAREELDAIARASLEAFPRPAWASLQDGLVADQLQDDLTRAARPALLAILGAVGLLLALASVNVANLVLARNAERGSELAVRGALGASRLRIARQVFTEISLLTALGGALGVLLAAVAVDVGGLLVPPELPRTGSIEVNGPVLMFALGLTTLISLAIGVITGLPRSDGSLRIDLQQRSARVAIGRRAMRRTLVIGQVALAFVLLVGAGLLLRSLQRLFGSPPGFDAANLLTMQVAVSGAPYRDPNAMHRFFDEALEAVRRVPGVAAAAFSSQLPLTGDEDLWGINFESAPTGEDEEDPDGFRYAVSPGYFEAMGIPLRRGRLLNQADRAGGPRAVVINESFAKRRLRGLDPIGQRVRIGPSPWFTVVGVVGDVKQTSLAVSRANAVYMIASQWEQFADRVRWLVIRSRGDAASLTPAIRRAIWSVDKNQPILRIATMDDRLRVSEAERRFALLLFESFAVLALFLAAIGTYGLISSGVMERMHEIGVRVALGASRRGIVALVLRQGMTLLAIGLLAGGAAAIIGARALVSLLFGVSPLDLFTYLSVMILLACVSAAACALPAWRAARVDPSIALRAE